MKEKHPLKSWRLEPTPLLFLHDYPRLAKAKGA